MVISFTNMKHFFLAGAIVLISIHSLPAKAKDLSDVAETAKQVSVRIEGATQGSGVIVSKEGNMYTVLTAWHVIKDVNQNEELAIITSDGKEHQRIIGSAQQFGSFDLAKITFKSGETYKFITPKKQINTSSGNNVFVGGFPLATSAVPYRLFRFLEGKVVATADIPISGGYQLLYSNQTLPGMSGGAVLDDDGNLIAIHGRGEISINETDVSSVSVKTGTNQGIPARYFFDQRVGRTKNAESYDDYLALAKSKIDEYDQQSALYYSNKSNGGRDSSRSFERKNIFLIDNAIKSAKKAVALKSSFESHLILGTAFWYKNRSFPFVNESPEWNTPDYKQNFKQWESKQQEIRDSVIKNLSVALSLNPDNIDALLYRGSVLEDMQDGGGIGDFTRAIAIDSDNLNARERRSNAYFSLAMSEGMESVERKKSYLRLSLEDDKFVFESSKTPSPNRYLGRGLTRLELSKLLLTDEKDLKIKLLIGACKDADIAKEGGVKTFQLIWDKFRTECQALSTLMSSNSNDDMIRIPVLDPSYEYIHSDEICKDDMNTRTCNFLRQIMDVRGFAVFLRCQMMSKKMARADAIWHFEKYRYTKGLSEEAYLRIYKEGGIDMPVVTSIANSSCPQYQ